MKRYEKINKMNRNSDVTIEGLQPLIWLSKHMEFLTIPKNLQRELMFGCGGVYSQTDKELKDLINYYMPETTLLDD